MKTMNRSFAWGFVLDSDGFSGLLGLDFCLFLLEIVWSFGLVSSGSRTFGDSSTLVVSASVSSNDNEAFSRSVFCRLTVSFAGDTSSPCLFLGDSVVVSFITDPSRSPNLRLRTSFLF